LGTSDESFELGFRWARGIAPRQPDRVLDFPAGSGSLIEEFSDRLRGSQLPVVAALEPPERAGPVAITGRVDTLNDNEARSDRWRVKVRGTLRFGDGPRSRRSVWVRLPGQAAYDVALAAHRNHQQVRIAGLWTDTAPNSVRIIADPDGLRVVDDNP
jgi:hypothetical protein